MILQLRKDIFSKEEPCIYDENGELLLQISSIKNGALFLNAKGQTIGQIFLTATGASVTVADAAPLLVTDVGDSFRVSPAVYDKNDLVDVTDISLHRLPDVEYILFGKPKSFQYTLYERKLKEVRPRIVATVINNPLSELEFKVRPEKDANLIKVVLLITAFALLSVR